jgi:hypothetical protein
VVLHLQVIDLVLQLHDYFVCPDEKSSGVEAVVLTRPDVVFYVIFLDVVEEI